MKKDIEVEDAENAGWRRQRFVIRDMNYAPTDQFSTEL